ncbi:uncharacterized protein LOC133200580 [Saccostrea echinata]|uniref:uncharacterized protein LOC133200580 n=1 Tax=Saccostrea echinata TaxID=191078 RepID=UPI002A82675A|nr:uncharacterized protein LOC133200580 [Saccostrea echinata]
MDEAVSVEMAADSEGEERLSRELIRNISMKREGKSTFVTFNDFFTKDPLDNSIPICTLRESVSSELAPDSPVNEQSALEDLRSDDTERVTSNDTEQEESDEDSVGTQIGELDGSKPSPASCISAEAENSEQKDAAAQCKDTGIATEHGSVSPTIKTPILNHAGLTGKEVPVNTPVTETCEDIYFKEGTDVESGLESVDVLQTADNGHVWANFKKEICQVDPTGKVIFRQAFEVLVDDFAVLGSNSVFLVESQSKTIRFLKIETGEPVITIFDNVSPDTPKNVCINTKTREIVVSILINRGFLFFKRVRTSIRKYSYNGKCIEENIPKNKGTVIFDSSLDMICNGNGDICIAAVKGLSHFIAVFDQSVNFRFAYDGGEGRQNSFRPTSVCIDCDNNILSLDSNSNAIHIIDLNGTFLRLMSPFGDNSTSPNLKTLCIFKGNTLLIGQDTGKIRVVKFTTRSETTKL